MAIEARILVIDDNLVTCKVVKMQLEKAGYAVRLCNNGQDGIQQSRAYDPDTILLDVMMPDMDGYEVCRRLKDDARLADIPIIMFTAEKKAPAHSVKGLQLGAVDYIPKDYNHEEMLARVAIQVRIKKLLDELQEKNAALEDANARLNETNRMLQELNKRDSLTGLYNHRHFHACLDEEYHRAVRYKSSMSCLMIDIDHFKRVNDTHGHPVGDEILKGVAAILHSSIRDVDIAARYGGEEFSVLLPETAAEEALTLAERLRTTIKSHIFPTEHGLLHVTVSIGVGSYPDHGPTSGRALIRFADDALYAAKSAGRDRTTVYTP